MNSVKKPLRTSDYKIIESEYYSTREPYVKVIQGIYNKSIPEITVYEDGKVERKYKLTEDQEQVINTCKECLNDLYNTYSEILKDSYLVDDKY